MRIIWKHMKRPLIITAGSLIALTGIILMPVPGPGGTPVFLAGLAILATEVAWARKVLVKFKESYTQMSKRKRRVLTYSSLVFYLVSGIVVWSWTNGQDDKKSTEISPIYLQTPNTK